MKQRENGISWCDYTFNPWWGCQKVSPACANCYAERFSRRLGFGSSKPLLWGGSDTARRPASEASWNELNKWNKNAEASPTRPLVFVMSMGDIMEDRHDLDAHRHRMWMAIEQYRNLDFLLLTKRPQGFGRLLPSRWKDSCPDNVILAVTVEDQPHVGRISVMLANATASRYAVSYEPALGPLMLSEYHCRWINWLIAGGETGHGARPSAVGWMRRIRDQCAQEGIAFHFKQWGAWLPDDDGQMALRKPKNSYENYLLDNILHRERIAMKG